MDAAERRRRIDDLLTRARVDPFVPWWAMDLIRIVEDLVTDVDDLGEANDKLDITLTTHQKGLDSLSHRYSELLYKMSSAE